MMRELTTNPINNEQGFTLIELVMIIVILGMLAAVAIPKYIDLKNEAGDSAAKGIAAALGSASSINRSVHPLDKHEGVNNCTDIEDLLEGELPADYEIVAKAIGLGGLTDCNVKHADDGYSSLFVGHGVTP